MDVQNILLWGILVGGLIYETTMWVYNKMTKGESFSAEKFALTYGYVALLAIVAYLGTGTIPAVADIISKLGEAVPDPTTVFTAASALVIFLYQQGKKALSPAIPTPPTETPPVVTPGGTGFEMGYTVTPTYTEGKSPLPVAFKIYATQPQPDHPGITSVDIDWSDGQNQNVGLTSGAAEVGHIFAFTATPKYTGHTFFPVFCFNGSDGSKTYFNVDGKGVEIWVQA